MQQMWLVHCTFFLLPHQTDIKRTNTTVAQRVLGVVHTYLRFMLKQIHIIKTWNHSK